MNEPAAIHATYADYRRVKGRKVFQLIMEVPIERAPEVHKYLGEPEFSDKQISVAIAKLNLGATREGWPAEDKPEKPRSSRLSQQAALCCQDELFWRFLEHRLGVPLGVVDITGENGAATILRNMADVESRAEFDTDSEAAQRWKDLHGEYLTWKAA